MIRFSICCFSICLTLLSLCFPGSSLLAQQTATPPQQSKELSAPKVETGQRPDMGAILVKGLKEVDGCLGVKTCRWDDGKNSIVAWFENKEAAAAWYHSATHQAMIGGKTEGYAENKIPMEHIKNADQPIMVIASLTPSDRPELPGMDIPISQISIELFAPLPGGAMIGGRVSPDQFKIPHMNDYTPSKQKRIESKE